ncbi:MAG: hypothetical protein A2096_12825 [Spirochaetes bacterium GWF1_41_5]|nr:MAG: hypothetical protein A2096_12825 [Spirochaetes bacterium GWF1_41_5]
MKKIQIFTVLLLIVFYRLDARESAAELQKMGYEISTNDFFKAAADNNIKALELFLQSGFPVNIEKEYRGTLLVSAARANAAKAAAFLFKTGATNVNVRETWKDSGETALIKGAKFQSTEACIVLLMNKADPNIANINRWTPLMFAARNNNADLITMLAAYKADLEATNAFGWTALMLAAEGGNPQAVNALLKAGANPSHQAGAWNAARLALRMRQYAVAKMLDSKSGKKSLDNEEKKRLNSVLPGMTGKTESGSFRTCDSKYGFAVELVKNAQHPLSITILPFTGSRIISFKYGQTELLAEIPNYAELLSGFGFPILYPTPNRVQDGVFEYHGKKYEMSHPAAPGPVNIHGFVRDDIWEFDKPQISDQQISIRTFYTHDEKSPRFSAFPWQHTLYVDYTLQADRLVIAYTVSNRANEDFGFGFGLHPYWRYIGNNEDTLVQADIKNILKDMRGKEFISASGKKDLTFPRVIAGANYQEMYFKLTPENTVKLIYKNTGIAVHHKATADFTHLIVWGPNGKPYFSIENQTCSADVHNMHALGNTETANLQVVKPREVITGKVEYIIENLK